MTFPCYNSIMADRYADQLSREDRETEALLRIITSWLQEPADKLLDRAGDSAREHVIDALWEPARRALEAERDED
jgi:hypothetical protein